MSFSTSPASTKVDRGGEVSFTCTYPPTNSNVSISWMGPGVNAGSITKSIEMSANTTVTRSTLAIMNVNSSHAGDYFCTANVGEGMVVSSTTASLAVNCK